MKAVEEDGQHEGMAPRWMEGICSTHISMDLCRERTGKKVNVFEMRSLTPFFCLFSSALESVEFAIMQCGFSSLEGLEVLNLTGYP